MTYYIKGKNGKYAMANFEIRGWNGSNWTPDMAHDLEVNVPWGTVMTWEEYQDIIDYWKNYADADGYDMTGLEIFANDFDELAFCLDKVEEV